MTHLSVWNSQRFPENCPNNGFRTWRRRQRSIISINLRIILWKKGLKIERDVKFRHGVTTLLIYLWHNVDNGLESGIVRIVAGLSQFKKFKYLIICASKLSCILVANLKPPSLTADCMRTWTKTPRTATFWFAKGESSGSCGILICTKWMPIK